MNFRQFRKAGHFPSLIAALMHFEVSFSVWVLLGVLGPFIAEDFDLSPRLKGLLVATPLLGGAVFRVAAGLLADRFGPRRVGTVSMVVVIVPLAWAYLGGNHLAELFAIGALLGIAGASFSVALPLASRSYPPHLQGLAVGIAGAGNSGTILAGLIAPRLAEQVGWHATVGLAVIPVALAAVVFRLMARETPAEQRTSGGLIDQLKQTDCWRLCGMYAVTFGGFVGLAAYLPFLLIDRYGLSRITTGTLVAVAAGAGSFMRPVGGLVSDRVGGTRVLGGVYLAAAALAIALSASGQIVPAALAAFCLLGVLGLGNGAVTQLVAIRFRKQVGATMGMLGAAGGIGGFIVPSVLGALKQLTGSYWAGLYLFAAFALIAAAGVMSLRVRWTAAADRHALEGAF